MALVSYSSDNNLPYFSFNKDVKFPWMIVTKPLLVHLPGDISSTNKEAELNCPVSFRDLYESVHKRKNGKYVTHRSKNIIDSYDTTMLEKYGEDSSMHPMVDQDVWLEVTGLNKKGQIHGMSHNLDMSIHGSSFASSSHVAGSSNALRHKKP